MTQEQSPFFIVLGPHRSGSSCTAMVMHHLGIFMGNSFVGCEPGGGGEAAMLAELCEWAMPFPSKIPHHDDLVVIEKLTVWVDQFDTDAKARGTFPGGKYPHLCRFADHLYEILGKRLRVIAMERPIADSIRSLENRTARFLGRDSDPNIDACAPLQRMLLDSRERFLQSHPHVPVYRVDYLQMLSEPTIAIDRLIHFLGIEPNDDSVLAARGHIDPTLLHFK